MILEIRSDAKAYTEKIDLKELEDYFNELKNNGANPHLNNITFQEWTRPIKDKIVNLYKYNGGKLDPHFIFGYLESLFQSDDCPEWVQNHDCFEVINDKDYWESSRELGTIEK